MKTEKRLAAIYCRVACADAAALENQRRSVIGFARAKGFGDCAEYLDNGGSGLTLNRPAFTRLHEDMQAGKIQALLTKDIARIGRDFLKVGAWMDEARQLGVEIIFEHDRPDDFEGILLEGYRAIRKAQKRKS